MISKATSAHAAAWSQHEAVTAEEAARLFSGITPDAKLDFIDVKRRSLLDGLMRLLNGKPRRLTEWFLELPEGITVDSEVGSYMLEVLQRLSSQSAQPIPVPTDNKLLGVIAALWATFPGRKIPSAKELEKAAASVGVAITDDTIRKALKAVREVAKDLPPA
jgi:hypothetical protein